MGLATLFDRFFRRPALDTSRTAAKDRLRLVLMHDRSDIPATMMDAIRAEMIHALSKYVEIDTEALELDLQREHGAIGLVLNIPIRRVKSEAEAAEALAAMHALQSGHGLPPTKAPVGTVLDPAIEALMHADAAKADAAKVAEANVDPSKSEAPIVEEPLVEEPQPTPAVEEDEEARLNRNRDTGDLVTPGDTGDLVAERAEPND